MNKDQAKRYEQEILFFNSLQGEAKKNYFIDFFVSEILLSLADKRKENKISQNQLAKYMDVKQSYISKIENLEKIPTIETIAKYYFGLNELLSLETNEKAKFSENHVEATFNFIQKLDEYSNILSGNSVRWGTNDDTRSCHHTYSFSLNN